MSDSYTYIIIALLPLSACMLVFQLNPFHALVVRGILGAVAALVYAVLGAADVALTEALVGTMLSITLYAVAVRSSLIMRLGIIETEESSKVERNFEQLLNTFRGILGKYYVRLELVPYTNTQALERALIDKEVHATCMPQYCDPVGVSYEDMPPYHTQTRIQRLYEIMQTELSSLETTLTYVKISDSGEKH